MSLVLFLLEKIHVQNTRFLIKYGADSPKPLCSVVSSSVDSFLFYFALLEGAKLILEF